MKRFSRKKLIYLILFACLVVGGLYVAMSDVLSVEKIKQHELFLRQLVADHYALSVLFFFVVYAVSVACSLPFVAPLSLAGGYLFGFVSGMLYSISAFGAGATASFIFIRTLFSQNISLEWQGPLARYWEGFKKNSTLYLLLLHLSSVFPLVLINSIAVVAKVRTLLIAAISVVGSLPFIALHARFGSNLRSLHSFNQLWSPTLFALVIVYLVALVAGLFLGNVVKVSTKHNK